MLRPLTISDPAFLCACAGGEWGIVGDAAPAALSTNTAIWHKASRYDAITTDQYINNLAISPANWNNSGYSNLIPLDASAALGASSTEEDYYVNLMYHSEDMRPDPTVVDSPWQYSNGSASNATDLTFTGSGYVRQYVYMTYAPGEMYVVRAKIKINSGTPTIEFKTGNSASGSSQVLGGTPSGTYQTFQATFLGGASTYVDVGLVVDSACSISVTEFQVRRAADYNGYVATTTTPTQRALGEVKTWAAAPQLNVNIANSYGGWKTATAATGLTLPTAATFYIAFYKHNHAYSNGYIANTTSTYTNDPILGVEISGSYYQRLFRGSWINSTNVVPLQQWCILTYQMDTGAGASMMRLNKNAAYAVTAGTTYAKAFTFGGIGATAFGRGSFHEFIYRPVLDNTATQDAIIEYLASWLGISV